MVFTIGRNGNVVVQIGNRSPLFIPQNSLVLRKYDKISIINNGIELLSFKKGELNARDCDPPLDNTTTDTLVEGLQTYFNSNPNMAINELTQAVRDLITLLTP